MGGGYGRPGDDVGQRHVMIQFDLGRRDDRLVIVVGLRRDGEDLLPRQLGRALARLHRRLAGGVDGRQILADGVVLDLGIFKWRLQSGRAIEQRQRADQINHDDECDVSGVGLGEAVGIDAGTDKISRPQGDRLCGGLDRRRLAAQKHVAEIVEEDARPRLQFAQQCRRPEVPVWPRGCALGGSGIASCRIALGPGCGTVRHHPRPWSKYSDYSGKLRARDEVISDAKLLFRQPAAACNDG